MKRLMIIALSIIILTIGVAFVSNLIERMEYDSIDCNAFYDEADKFEQREIAVTYTNDVMEKCY